MKDLRHAGYRWLEAFLFSKLCLSCKGRGYPWCVPCEVSLLEVVDACPACGRVWLEPQVVSGHLCGACARRPPPYLRAQAAFAYGGALQEAITRWKNQPYEAAGAQLASLLDGVAPMKAVGCVIPIPSTRASLLRRGFNPAALLAARFAARRGLAFQPGDIYYVKAPPSSRGMRRKERVRRLKGCFGAREVAGKHVLIVDDVMTTGATIQEASLACLAAGALSVEAVVLARVLEGG